MYFATNRLLTGPFRSVAAVWLALTLFGPAPPQAAGAMPTATVRDRKTQTLRRFTSRRYLIHTNLNRKEVLEFGKHMDRIFEEYRERFAKGSRRLGAKKMPLYLWRTRDDYSRFLAGQNINATNSAGMFFIRPVAHGLATWTQGRSRSQTLAVLQHEGFHQFAHHYIGPELPIWMNEGMAEYFEDAIVIGQNMETGLANARRIQMVRNAIDRNRIVGFRTLLTLTNDQWNATLSRSADESVLLYAQSWSIVFFLVHGEDGRYQGRLEKCLKLLSQGRSSASAFREAFGTEDLSALAHQWKRSAQAQQPDPVNAAAGRLEFLGSGLRFMHRKRAPVPRSLGELQRYLQSRGFRLRTKSHGLVTNQSAMDRTLYEYQRHNGSVGPFRLLEPVRHDQPPRITAPGLKPEPTLVWWRDSEGQLVHDIEYR